MDPDSLLIAEGVYRVGGEDLSAPGDAAAYLVVFGDRAAVIDAGTGRGAVRLTQNIRACLPEEARVETLFLTHCHYDHTGGAAALREGFGCRIAAHERDAVFLEHGDSTVTAAGWYGARMESFPVDLKISEDRRTFPLGPGFLETIHTPGHTPGSMVLVTETGGRKILFGQDVHGPLSPEFLSDPALYRSSLEKMLALNADILCEGHFGVISGKGDVADFIRSYLR